MATTLPPLLADQLPPDLSDRQAMIQRLTAALDSFGYLPVNTPLVEHADLFLIKAGDAAINRLVSFDLAGQVLCLRPEFTAPASRVYIEHFQHHAGAVRLQFAGPILQHESLGHGEITQQDAIGAELINERSAAADAEVIALAAQMLDQSGASKWTLAIGHTGLIERFIDRYKLDRQMHRFVLAWLPALQEGDAGLRQAMAALEKLNTTPPVPEALTSVSEAGDSELALQVFMRATPQRGPSGGRTQEEIARRLLERQQRTDQRVMAQQALSDLRHFLAQATSPDRLLALLRGDALEPLAEQLVETLDLLAAYGLPQQRIAVDLSFTRNLDYYTGIVFEYRTHAGDLLGGGGRYDELIGLLGATHHVPAVGFMLYLDSILRHLDVSDRRARFPRPVRIALRCVNHAQQANAIRLAATLRASGRIVTTDFGSGTASPFTTHLLVIDPTGAIRIEPADDANKAVILPAGAALETILNTAESVQ